jgi:hypothetical protein
MLHRNFRVQKGSNKIELALPESISSGSYIVRVSMGDRVVQEKLIVK